MKGAAWRERAVTFGPPGALLVGVLHSPEYLTSETGVVVIVGGPQYRVGSHRQFVLLARDLARHGIPVLRFDYSGMGDSLGGSVAFDQTGPDIGAAVDFLLDNVRGLSKVCLWGLCDAASAALMYAPADRRVESLLLLNPWVRTESGLAQAYIENYYGRRLRSGAFWRKALGNPTTVLRSARDFLKNVLAARSPAVAGTAAGTGGSFLDRMLRGAVDFEGRMLILLSGRDTVATEFEVIQQRDARWARAFARRGVTVSRLEAADHTFSRREWRDWVSGKTAEFILKGTKS